MDKAFNETVRLPTIITNLEGLKMATKKERAHMDLVASMGCCVCVNLEWGETPAEIHHIGNGTMGKRSNNYSVIPLCHVHLSTGGYGVAIQSGREAWEANFGTEQELLEQTMAWLNL